MTPRPIGVLLAGLLAAPAALAQDAPPLDAAPKVPSWKIRAEPAAWYVAPGGTLKLPSSGGGQEIRVETLDLDNPRLSPYLDLHLRSDRWIINLTGFAMSESIAASAADDSGQIGDTAFAAGDLLKSRLDFESIEATVGYRLVENALNPSEGVYALAIGVDLLGGVRLYDTNINVQAVGGPATPSTHEFFGDPLIGARIDMDFYRDFTIDVQTTFGFMPGSHSALSIDVVVGGTYRPFDNVGLLFGYRQLLFDLQSGDGNDEFTFRGGMAGIYTGVEIRF